MKNRNRNCGSAGIVCWRSDLLALGFWVATLLSFENFALAEPTFPSVLEQDYKWQVKNDCGLCHINPLGTGARTAFGNAIPGAGTLGDNPTKLRAALLQLGTHDTDNDGKSDLDELRAGEDPNGDRDKGKIEYGCIGSVAGRTSHWPGVSALAGLLTVAALLRSRRR